MTIPIHDDDPHARRLRGGRMSAPFQTDFVTKCVEARRPILAVPAAAEVVIESLAHVRRRGPMKLLAFVVMPDHYHAVFALLPGHDLSDLMRRIGSSRPIASAACRASTIPCGKPTASLIGPAATTKRCTMRSNMSPTIRSGKA
jgi:hypothetical protein